MTEQQKQAFAKGEADAYFERNRLASSNVETNEWDNVLAQHLGKDESVLEIGCSDGRRLAALASLCPDAEKFVGIDPSNVAVSQGRAAWPELDLRVGTADHIEIDIAFDLVIFGFCLYLCDRDDLPSIVSSADASLVDGGTLAIIDFDPAFPSKRTYAHRAGLWSYKMDYAGLFLAFPSYTLVEKHSGGTGGNHFHRDQGERISLSILRKELSSGYAVDEVG
jgi:SAM-dependent methyltransferase